MRCCSLARIRAGLCLTTDISVFSGAWPRIDFGRGDIKQKLFTLIINAALAPSGSVVITAASKFEKKAEKK